MCAPRGAGLRRLNGTPFGRQLRDVSSRRRHVQVLARSSAVGKGTDAPEPASVGAKTRALDTGSNRIFRAFATLRLRPDK